MALRYPLVKRSRRRGLDRYLLDGERIVIAAHQHWAKVALPFVYLVAGLVLVVVVDSSLPAGLGVMTNLLWWGWFIVVGWAIWKVLQWRNDWFVATDVRLILTYGLITQQVGMMPLAKVTDMSYNRSPAGRLLGYGTFVLESAGQDQALHRVRWVAEPDHTYRAICAEIFGVDDHEHVLGVDGHDRVKDRPPSKTSTPYTDFGSAPNGPDTAGGSSGMRIRPAGSELDDADSWRREPTSRDSDREADTGPIP